ncbi:uncharacterized protein METZ01_LOCUS245329 [marine metagenome]|uniref:Uncharacterized protein n=1 Tax=marine metagenome TaxID=408172 RepID=A0A382HZC9_9ZZZZ
MQVAWASTLEAPCPRRPYHVLGMSRTQRRRSRLASLHIKALDCESPYTKA